MLEGLKRGGGICFGSEIVCVIYKVYLFTYGLFKGLISSADCKLYRGMMGIIDLKKLQIPWKGAIVV